MTIFSRALRDLLAALSDGKPFDALHPQWSRLLAALVGNYPADASTLMVSVEGGLQPVAVLGMGSEVCGRRFQLEAHPRLAAIAAHPHVCRFPRDCALPDPFDGLLDADLTHVHDCMGIALRDGDRLLGMLTLDALIPEQMAGIDDEELMAAAELLATCLRLTGQLEDTRSRLNQVLSSERGTPLGSPGWHSPAMARLFESMALVAPTDLSVLLHGETGVGKEHLTRHLHERSRRSNGPLVRVNCATLPESLIESALFGHRRGAFSGANRDHQGHFVMADGGTLMLDEIGELPLCQQPRLLRVLQEGEIQPLGSDQSVKVDVRLVAVTNRDLAEEVAAGRFREDLYHRLSVFPLRIPPLRERREDILLLAGHFLEDNRVRLGLANLRLDIRAEQALLAWHWPGNVRELEHTLSRAALRAMGATHLVSRRSAVVCIGIQHLDLPAETASSDVEPEANHLSTTAFTQPTVDNTLSLREATDTFQRYHIEQVLAAHDHNWAASARALDMDSANLHRLGRRLGLK
ncbi:nitric oxide reductase transcriptional regulator NorR [Kushneria phyllosphaerae]|uniref:Anaerobic nitric oxide reductase transcription regulator NorR n=1 Tax=Kushneria phyllosphaerae TaxID=2100822 RepID=A0A2R8CI15_9GAMM|nr:nitric oxide reductase transcriptional regulator NorR [Kushneria phyllosphaerae]SPJ32394.1 Anaerobic nitric oxide reductase transcription regulator NorR [Kushneria phyllosphaerae]